MRITPVSILLFLAIVFSILSAALATTGDVAELVGDVLVEHVWGDAMTAARVRIGDDQTLSAYGGVERFILGTKGAWFQRWHETKYFPIEQVSWIQLVDYQNQMHDVAAMLRARADWHEQLRKSDERSSINFRYSLGNIGRGMVASEAMLVDDYLAIFDSEYSQVILINRSIVERIEWPDGEMEVTAAPQNVVRPTSPTEGADAAGIKLSVVEPGDVKDEMSRLG